VAVTSGQLEKRRPVSSLRVKLLLPVLVVLTLVVVAAYWIVRHEIEHSVLELSRDELALFSDSTRLSLVNLMRQGADDSVLQHALEQLRRSNPTIGELRLLHGPAVTRQFGLHSDEVPSSLLEKQVLASGEAALESCPECDVPQLRFVYPIRAEKSCLGCHQAREGETLGLFSGSMDMSHIQAHIRRSDRVVFYVATTAALVVFAWLAWQLNMLVFRRVDRLKEVAGRLAAGDLDVRVDESRNDELGHLFQAFNNMADRLQRAMENLDKDLQDQTEQLGHMLTTNQLLTSSQAIEHILNEFIQTMTESVKVTYGRILRLQHEDRYLQLAASHPARELSSESRREGCDGGECPLLFNLLQYEESQALRLGSPMSEAERELLFFNGTQWVLCLPIVYQGQRLGMVLLNEERAEEREPITDQKLHYARAMTHELAAIIANARLNEHLTQQIEEAVFAMAEVVDKKSPWTASHAQRVAEYARAIGEEMQLSSEEQQGLYRAGLLHDIGKIGTPGAILNKEGSLAPEEYEQLKRHSADGADILMRMRGFAPLIPAVKYHHEQYDGSGYPEGLKSGAIPLSARIMGVADAFDAMTSDRPYRQGMSIDEAWAQLQVGAGSQFDPGVVTAFRRVLEKHDGDRL